MVQLAVDLALALLLIECGVLIVLAWRQRLPLPRRAFATLGAGFCLLLALRMSVAEGTTLLILPVMAFAGICHILDLSFLIGRSGAPPVTG